MMRTVEASIATMMVMLQQLMLEMVKGGKERRIVARGTLCIVWHVRRVLLLRSIARAHQKQLDVRRELSIMKRVMTLVLLKSDARKVTSIANTNNSTKNTKAAKKRETKSA